MKTLTLVATASIMLVTGGALAKENKQFQEQITVDTNSTIKLEVGVGEFELSTHDGQFVNYTINVEEADSKWFGHVDWDDIKVQQKLINNTLHLEVDGDDIKQTWHISVPRDANIELDMGVGEAHLTGVEADVEAELGVGELHIETANSDYRKINLESGVGEARLSGFKGQQSSRSFVSEEINWHGEGKYSIEAEVGVGEVSVTQQ
ncbi:hypothetical protein [Neptunicella marina]|uniref:Adhesin domain-containing protein n=1 Tax=Neptunicella marina TaxID=2125989 RepID=A0A8J6IX19_9ALTE|nr:hypothetical protein [Neptunicella marina]MBC3766933.1 hypothetical protein [Neptunicella marina]